MELCKLPDDHQVMQLASLVREEIFSSCPHEESLAQIRDIITSFSSKKVAEAFEASLPEIGELLKSDLEAISLNDPAVKSMEEVIACYPGFRAILHYRIAHKLLELKVEIVPRMITEMAHSLTGIDIHPAAQIGGFFAIDHGTGVVIGETSIIGEHVMLYQGVTLGAKNFVHDEKGKAVNLPRHPILEDNVTVYSNTSILGRVRIGHDTVIGGNIWLTHDVPPNSKILQSSAVYIREFDNGSGI